MLKKFINYLKKKKSIKQCACGSISIYKEIYTQTIDPQGNIIDIQCEPICLTCYLELLDE